MWLVEATRITQMNLTNKAKEIRELIIKTIFNSKSGHIGGSLSCLDILVSLYFGKNLRIKSSHPNDENRDRLIVSKGHASAAVYSVLASRGFFNKKMLKRYCKNNSYLSSHLSKKVPGVEFDTGSLGHGLGIGCGIAFSAMKDRKNYKVFVICSDGELYEGSTWEAILFAQQKKLKNLILIIDRNNQIVMDKTEDCIKLDPLEKKFLSFGFNAQTIDGHDFKQIDKAIKIAKTGKYKKPQVIIAKTIKGKGVAFMEKEVKWHHSVPNQNEFIKALKILK